MRKFDLKEMTVALKGLMLLCGMAFMAFGFTACDDDNDEPAMKGKNITVIMSKLGRGNNDYCSLITKTIDEWEKSGKVPMKVHYPKTNEEAEQLYRNWAKESANGGQSLMVVANGEYEHMVQTIDLKLKDNQQVLAFETPVKDPYKNVHTFEIIHNGVAYLAGTMASLSQGASVIVGYATPRLANAYEMFRDGFGKYNKTDCPMVELKDNYSGFNMVDEAYALATDPKNQNNFILPLAGMSNEGVYKYLDECVASQSDNEILSCGVDVNLNSRNKRIAFSYLINIDKAVDIHLQSWLDGKPWPKAPFGLANGMTGIEINPEFEKVGEVTKEGLKKLYDENLEEAKKKD